MTEEQSPAQIDPDILISLGIKEEDVQRYDRDKIELRRSGEDTYRRLLREFEGGVNATKPDFNIGRLGVVRVGPLGRIGDFPDAVMEAALADPVLSKRISEVKEWLAALGEEALTNHGDWKTAVVAYDVATDGKIADTPGLMLKLSEVAKQDIVQGVGIAKTMQARRNIRQAGVPVPPVATEAPPTT